MTYRELTPAQRTSSDTNFAAALVAALTARNRNDHEAAAGFARVSMMAFVCAKPRNPKSGPWAWDGDGPDWKRFARACDLLTMLEQF